MRAPENAEPPIIIKAHCTPKKTAYRRWFSRCRLATAFLASPGTPADLAGAYFFGGFLSS
jgi:hypothetical protein